MILGVAPVSIYRGGRYRVRWMRRCWMGSINMTGARAVADLAEGQLLASVEIAAAPERVFRALLSQEITEWWVRPGVFDTREWAGTVRVGGRWRAAGMTRGQPYVQITQDFYFTEKSPCCQ